MVVDSLLLLGIIGLLGLTSMLLSSLGQLGRATRMQLALKRISGADYDSYEFDEKA